MAMARTLLLLVVWVWVPTEIVGRTVNSNKVNNTVPSKPNVVRIGALFTVDSVIGRSAKPALLAAVEDVNSDTSILNGIKLEVLLHDTNCSGFLGTVEGIYQNLKFQELQAVLFFFFGGGRG